MVSTRANPAQRVCFVVWWVLRAVWRAIDEAAQRVVRRCVLTSIPTHLAFVMDGNRRFATAAGLQQVEGHKAGASTLVEALEWCLGLGVRVVSVYAFSLENFKRSPEEVEALMALAVDKLNALREDKDGVLRRYQVRVRMMGDLDRLPPDVRAAAAQLELATAGHRLAALNVCFAYTGRHDMLQAMHAVQASLYTGDCPPVGLLIRTSGETRLSDFMSMQCADAALVFLSVLWPDFSFWHLVWALWLYQRAHPALRDTDGKAHPRDWAGLAPPPVDCTRGDMCMCSGGVPTHHVGLAKQQVAVNLCADDQDVALGLPVRDEGDRLVRLHAGQLIRRVRVGEMSGGRTHGDRLAEVDAGQLRNGRPTGSWGPNGMQHAQQRRVEKFLQRRLEDRWAWLHRMLPAS